MKIRLRFSKQGSLKFVGHLDIQRYFQRVLRRAEVKMRYSEGFNPHPVMSFAAPLGVGLTSDGEYVDIEVLKSPSSKEMIERINSCLSEELRVLSCRLLPDNTPKAMAQVSGADYTVRFYPEKEPKEKDLFKNGYEAFLLNEHIPALKETKSGTRTVDIRPMIYGFEIEDDMTIKLRVATGSAANLKPETLMTAYMESLGLTLRPVSLLINREDLYAEGFISLGSFGEEIADEAV